MEFWGVEVKAGQILKVNPGPNKLLHLSQASLGETKKGKANESVPLFLKVDDQKLVIGTLSAEKCNHITYDLVFEKEFELSHNWANGSVYFCGYKSVHTEDSLFTSDDDDSRENESEEDIPLLAEENGIPEQKDAPSKPSTGNAKSKVKVVEPIKEEKVKEEVTDSDDDEDESEDDDESDVVVKADIDDDEDDDSSSDEDDDESSDEDNDESSDEDNDESSEEEDEATPKKAEQNKKRPAPAESDTKTPTGNKKIGGEGKKTSGHIATPYPSKQTGKTPANNDKSKQQTPASDGQVTCGSCSRSFKSNQALESHSKAKHGAAN